VLDADRTALLLTVDDGFVSSIVVDVTFVDDRAKVPARVRTAGEPRWMREE
jgi:hypothetical protein